MDDYKCKDIIRLKDVVVETSDNGKRPIKQYMFPKGTWMVPVSEKTY